MHPSWTIVLLAAGLLSANVVVDVVRAAPLDAVELDTEGFDTGSAAQQAEAPVEAPEPAPVPAPRWEEAEWPDDHRGAFLSEAAPLAYAVGRDTCALPSVTLAQAILETGWGRSGLARRHHNWFGIKGEGTVLPTIEYVDTPTLGSFRVWDSPEASVRAYAGILRDDHRYAHAWKAWPDGRGFARAISGRWATNPDYAKQLVWLIDRYELDRWDGMVSESGSCAPPDGSRQS
jgi:flagellum-specific peptidoglycan hydrolase FlgJ